MTIKSIIEKLHEETNLPVDYLEFEQEKSTGNCKVDCENFVHWDLKTLAYSVCSHYHQYIINMNHDCKNCTFYKRRIDIE